MKLAFPKSVRHISVKEIKNHGEVEKELLEWKQVQTSLNKIQKKCIIFLYIK